MAGDAQLTSQRPLCQLVTTTTHKMQRGPIRFGTIKKKKKECFSRRLSAIRVDVGEVRFCFVQVLLEQKMADPVSQ